jgi:hypothetical protein
MAYKSPYDTPVTIAYNGVLKTLTGFKEQFDYRDPAVRGSETTQQYYQIRTELKGYVAQFKIFVPPGAKKVYVQVRPKDNCTGVFKARFGQAPKVAWPDSFDNLIATGVRLSQLRAADFVGSEVVVNDQATEAYNDWLYVDVYDTRVVNNVAFVVVDTAVYTAWLNGSKEFTKDSSSTSYQSIYQIPLYVPYCSDTKAGGELDKYPCSGGQYLHWESYTGFKDQWNPTDPKRACQQETGTCSKMTAENLEYSLNLSYDQLGTSQTENICSEMFRYYIPKGTKLAALNIYGPPATGQCATVARFGKAPTYEVPNTYTLAGNKDYWGGKTIKQLTDNDCIASNEGGHITVLYNNAEAIETGGWLYVKFFKYSTAYMLAHIFTCAMDRNIYTTWYNAFEDWLDTGDPPEGILSNNYITVTPTSMSFGSVRV